MNDRNQELKLIHVAWRELGLDEDTYRDMLWTVARVRSAAELDGWGRRRVLEHMKARGFRARVKRRRSPGGVASMNQALMGKVEALLADQKLEWAYADGIARRMFNVDSVRFCDAKQLRAVIAALTYRQQREDGDGR